MARKPRRLKVVFLRRRKPQAPYPAWKTAKDLATDPRDLDYKRGAWGALLEMGPGYRRDARGRPIQIGEGEFGRIFISRIRFRDGQRHWVAVKVFKKPLTDALAQAYQACIRDLRNAGARIPKMGMVKLPSGEWVQLIQLYGSVSRRSLLVPKSYGKLKIPANRTDAVRELTKVANAGYLPSIDYMEPYTDLRRGVIYFDLDYLVREGRKGVGGEPYAPKKRAQILCGLIEDIAGRRDVPRLRSREKRKKAYREAARLFFVALAEASEEMRPALERQGKEWIRYARAHPQVLPPFHRL